MPPKVSPVKGKKKGARRRKVKVKKIPRFTIEELNEEFNIFLNTYNPYISENCVEFDRKKRTFKPILDNRKAVMVYKQQGSMRKKISEGVENLVGEILTVEEEEIIRDLQHRIRKVSEGEILFAQAVTKEQPQAVEEEEIIRNKFNFSEVALQTIEPKPKERGNQIDSSLFPVLAFQGTVSKFEITKAYEKHEKEKDEKNPYYWIQQAVQKLSKYVGRKATPFQDSSRRYLRLCERMVDQNLTEANLDYSFYDNPNDEFRPDFGSLLPLWKTSCVVTRGQPVTSIGWSLHFPDLFAVGSRNFKEEEGGEEHLGTIREDGYVCVFSLKGPNYPEKVIQCQAAVHCLSFHPEWSHLLAVGCEDGTLNVFDLRNESNSPVGINKMTEKFIHHDIVSELKWLPDVLPQKFCTVSVDGKILIWEYMCHGLFSFDDVTCLVVKDWPGEVPPRGIETETASTLQEGKHLEKDLTMASVSISVNPHTRDLFIVGTEAGVIYNCSFDDKRQLENYVDHKHSVHKVHWNPCHKRVFLSSSDDMTIRIWDHSMRESVFEFFFEYEVKDACWAPFSSTLFAAISGNAVLYVFDLAVNKKEAIGTYTVYAAKECRRLTTVCFHPSKPVVMVGDERGCVISFKLSPNLRSSLKALETLEKSKFIAGEEEKMEKLLAPAKGRMKKIINER